MNRDPYIMLGGGGTFHFKDPTKIEFGIEEVAQSLSCTCRFAGHFGYYSVAEHCIRVATLCQAHGAPKSTVILGLLHDAAECIIGDFPTPLKNLCIIAVDEEQNPLWLRNYEERVLRAALWKILSPEVHASICEVDWHDVDKADKRILEVEFDEIAEGGFIDKLTPEDACLQYMKLYSDLTS